MRVALLLMFCGLCAAVAPGEASPAPAPPALRVLSFNMWVGGEGGKLPLSQTAEVIKASRADVVGAQETYGRKRNGVAPDNARAVADLLGWHYVDQGDGKGILSRFEILGLTPDKQGAAIRLPDGGVFHLFNVHLFHAPYQPYQLLKIPYEDAPFLDSAAALIEAAQAARGAEFTRALDALQPLLNAGKPLALTGDFNEPSFQDWTDRAVAAGTAPLTVRYPATASAVARGLVDAYRSAFPDEVAHPGWTWTPTTAADDPKDRHDRIDFVFVSPSLKILRTEIVGEAAPQADITVLPYPSDHRAVVATLAWPMTK